MKKSLVKIISAILAVCMIVGCGALLGGCSSDPVDTGKYKATYNVDGPNKLTIKVKNFGGGPGNLWLEQAMDRFAELKKDTKYGNKTGVYLKMEVTYDQKTQQMDSDSTNIYFDERFSDVYQLAQSGLLLNIDSIVKDSSRVGGSLEDALFDSVKGGIKANDGSYYGLPHYEYYNGLAYNRETFDELFAYFAYDESEGYEYTCKYGKAYMVNDLTSDKSVGPDGQAGTEDDGLPRSLDEFIILMNYIKEESDSEIAPISLSGKHHEYADYIICGFWASLAGAEQMKNYYNCTGEIEVVKRDEHGNLMFTNDNLFEGINYIKKPVTEKITMKADGTEGWKGQDMAAKYYAYAMYSVIKNEGFFSATESSSKDHWTTQLDLFMDGKVNSNECAMLCEGSYWYNEAKENGGFSTFERYIGKEAKDLDVRWMSLPTDVKTEDAKGKAQCFLDGAQAYTMINGNVASNEALKQACLDFVAFLYSEQELANFTALTGLARSIKYNVSNSQLAEMGHYGSTLWKARDNQSGSNVVALSGTTKTFRDARATLKICLGSGIFTDGNSKFWNLVQSGKTAAQVFNDTSLYGAWSYGEN